METRIIIPEYRDQISNDELNEFPDLLACLDYLLLKDSEDNLSMEEIAESLSARHHTPSSRQGLYLRVDRWRSDGTLERANALFVAPKVEELRSSIHRAITAMPEMVDKLVSDALDATKSPKLRMEIMQTLMTMAAPQLTQNSKGSAEKKFTQRPQNFDPVNVPEEG